MAVTYLRLFDPVNQFQLKNGAINVSGRLYIYLEGTDDYADLYDENGSQLQQPVVLDNNGRAAGLFVDAKKTYWMKVNDQYDATVFTIRKMTPCGGGGGSVLSGTYNVVSTDGSIAIDKSIDAGNTTFDLTKPSDSTELLEWFRSDSYYQLPDTNIYRPSCTKGTMETGDVGVQILANQYYHVTGHILVSKNEDREPFYDEITIKYMLRGANLYDQLVMSSKVIVDYSLGLSQEFEVSTDVIPDEDCELYVVIENQNVNNGYFGLKDMEIHRICSGSPSIPSGVLSRAQAAELYQRKLIAGQNITITPTEEGDIIASTGGGGGGGGSDYYAGDGINISPNNTISVDTSVIQEKLTPGDNITINNNVISATQPDISGKADKVDNAVNGNLAGLDSNGNLTDSGLAADRVVTDPNYVHTDNNFTNEYKNKLINIEAGAQQNVQSDWTEADSSADSFIKNKPDMSQFITQADISGKADKVENATSGHLAGLDSTGNLTDSGISASSVSNLQPMLTAGSNITIDTTTWTISATGGTVPPMKELVAGSGITITEGDDTVTIESSGGSVSQVQSNWTETDSSDPSYIQNKPDLSIYAQSANLAAVATSGSYSDLSGKPNIVQEIVLTPSTTYNDWISAWNAASGDVKFLYCANPPQQGTSNTAVYIPATRIRRNTSAVYQIEFFIAENTGSQNSNPLPATYHAYTVYLTSDGWHQSTTLLLTNTAGVPSVGSIDDGKVLTATYNSTSGIGSYSWQTQSTPPTVTVDQTYSASSTNAQSGTAVAQAVASVAITVDQTYNASSTNAQSGTAVAGALAAIRQVPTTTSSDNGKFLTVQDSNGTLGWATIQQSATITGTVSIGG